MQQRRLAKEGRGSRFTDIPPDPSSFLADEERDGKPESKPERKSGEKKDKKHKSGGGKGINGDNGGGNLPSKGRQILGRQNKKPVKSASQQDFDSRPLPESDEMERNFTNLTVSVSKDGDYKSVRLSQAPNIGSGRVGPRQITKTQFQGIEPDMYSQPPPPHHKQNISNDFHRNQGPRKSDKRTQFNKEPKRNSNNSNNNMNFRQKSSPQLTPPHVGQKQELQAPNSKAFSVQDRLKRMQFGANPSNGDASANNNNNNNKNLILNIISANEIAVNNDERHRAANF